MLFLDRYMRMHPLQDMYIGVTLVRAHVRRMQGNSLRNLRPGHVMLGPRPMLVHPLYLVPCLGPYLWYLVQRLRECKLRVMPRRLSVRHYLGQMLHPRPAFIHGNDDRRRGRRRSMWRASHPGHLQQLVPGGCRYCLGHGHHQEHITSTRPAASFPSRHCPYVYMDSHQGCFGPRQRVYSARMGRSFGSIFNLRVWLHHRYQAQHHHRP